MKEFLRTFLKKLLSIAFGLFLFYLVSKAEGWNTGYNFLTCYLLIYIIFWEKLTG